jgi:hypothetical protein
VTENGQRATREIVTVDGFDVCFDMTMNTAGDVAFPVRRCAINPKSCADAKPTELLYADEAGCYYLLQWHLPAYIPGADDNWNNRISIVHMMDGKEALAWLVDELLDSEDVPDAHLKMNLRRAIWQEEFEFFPLVAIGQKPPTRRRRKKVRGLTPFAVQLEMATALVEAVRKLDAEPDAGQLAEARREV